LQVLHIAMVSQRRSRSWLHNSWCHNPIVGMVSTLESSFFLMRTIIMDKTET